MGLPMPGHAGVRRAFFAVWNNCFRVYVYLSIVDLDMHKKIVMGELSVGKLMSLCCLYLHTRVNDFALVTSIRKLATGAKYYGIITKH
jgi:hypothetical protein